MLKQRARLFTRLNVVSDLLVTLLAFVLAFLLRFGPAPTPEVRALFVKYFPILYFALPFWYVLFRINGMYESQRTNTIPKVCWISARSVGEGITLLVLIGYFLRITSISRSFILLFGLVNVLLLVLERALIMAFLRRLRSRGYNFRTVLVVGASQRARSVARKIRLHPEWGLNLFGFLSQSREEVGQQLEGATVSGGLEDLQEIISSNPIDEVHIALPLLDLDTITRILETCEEQGIRTRVMLDLYSPALSKVHLEDFLGTPMLTFTASPTESWELFIKEAIDRVAAMILVILLLPVLLLIAILIRIDSPGPVLFRQERVGLYKRRFRLYKFRTMVENAEALKDGLLRRNEVSGPAFKIRNDPRCTRVGRFLRRSSLDELPQLINVLRGEMSFIGPRPPIPAEADQYQPWQYRRLSMKPGISGLWQVSGRSELGFDKLMELDLQYIDNWSLKLDFKIFLKTFPAILLGRGAS